MQVCRSERGNTSHFRCPYHAWTYKNDGALVGVPFHQDAYGGEEGLRREGVGLLPAPRVASYRGLVFASLDADAPSYSTTWAASVLPRLLLESERRWARLQRPPEVQDQGELEDRRRELLRGLLPHAHTHASVVTSTSSAAPKARKRKEGALFFADSGGGTTYKLPTTDFEENLRHIGYPDGMIGRMSEVWSPEHRSMIGDAGFMPSAATVLPNLSFVHNWPVVDAEGLVVPFVSVRQWQPVSATETEVLSWFAVDRAAPDWFKRASYRAYVMCFGTSGMFEQDDVENWTSITQVARGADGGAADLHNRMGLKRDDTTVTEPIDWPAPGEGLHRIR